MMVQADWRFWWTTSPIRTEQVVSSGGVALYGLFGVGPVSHGCGSYGFG